MTSFDETGTDIGAMVETHLGDGTSDVGLAEGRRRFIAGVERLDSPATQPWWSGGFRAVLPAMMVVGAVGLTIGLVDLVQRRHQARPVATKEVPVGVVPPARTADRGGDAVGDRVPGEVIRLETSREQSGATVQLVSGATVTLSRRTRGESRHIAGKAYRVKLDYGEMAFTIDPQIGSTWTVEAGAYDVRVVGTIFSVKRDPDSESIEVHVDRGRVAVSGKGGVALGDRTVMLEAGATLRARKGDLNIQPSSPSTSSSSSSLSSYVAPLTRAPKRLAAANTRHSLAPAPASASAWTSLYAAGDYAGAWRAARADGYDQLVATLDVTGLAHLADAARLSGDHSSARSLLLALRRRFPSSREAANAAFLLGRSAADKGGGPTEASAWLQTYLVERPDGVYAEEARGRLMVVYQRAGHRADARRAARDYLGLYPTGSYATVACSLME